MEFQLRNSFQLTKQQKHNLRNRVQALGETQPHRLRFFSDEWYGHGWLEVTVLKLSSLGLHLSDFSTYSYTNGRNQGEGKPFEWFHWKQGPMNEAGNPVHAVYLEEDCDARIYLQRHKDIYQQMPIIQPIYLPKNSGIRDLPPIYNQDELSDLMQTYPIV